MTAGQQYLALIAPVNCASKRFYDAWKSVAGNDGQISYDEWRRNSEPVRAAALLGLVAQTDFVQKALIATWPDDVRPDVERLSQDEAAIGQYYRSVAEALAPEALAAVTPLPASVGVDVAAIVRAKLGLPSNLTVTDVVCPS